MTPARLSFVALLLLATAGHATVMAGADTVAVQVEVTGVVQRPGRQNLPAGARLSDAILAATPARDAYVLAAALLRRSEVVAQTRDKAGLLFDLQTLAEHKDTSPALAAEARRLHAWLDTLPVTGRVRHLLEPRPLEIERRKDQLLVDGDRIIYPPRPHTVQVAGAVDIHCELPHRALQDSATYLAECELSEAADRDWIYLVQPDGHVERLGVALWNRSPAQALAPGGIIVVPLSERQLRAVNPAFNAQMAAFVATQVLPLANGEP